MSNIKEMFDKITFIKDSRVKLIVNDKYVLEFKDKSFGSGYMLSDFRKENSCNRYYSWADVNVFNVDDPSKNISVARLYIDDDMDIIDKDGLTHKSMSLVIKREFLDSDGKTTFKPESIISITKCEFLTQSHT